MIERETTVYVLVPQPPAAAPTPSNPPSTASSKRMANDLVVALLAFVAFVAFLFGMAAGHAQLTTDNADVIPPPAARPNPPAPTPSGTPGPITNK
jgi:hypothetical protein